MASNKSANLKMHLSSQRRENEDEDSEEIFYGPQEDFEELFPFDKWTLSSRRWVYDERTRAPLYLNTVTQSSDFRGYPCPIPNPSIGEFYTKSSKELIKSWFRNPNQRRFAPVANNGLQDKPKKRKDESSKSQGDELNNKSGNKADAVAGNNNNKSNFDEMLEEAVDYEDFSDSEYNKAKEDASNKTAASKVDATVGRSGGKKDNAPTNKDAHDGGKSSGGANKTPPVKEKHILEKVGEIKDYERGWPWWPKDKPPPSPINWKNVGARSVGGQTKR